jgi:hypothetical protein
VHDRHAVAQRVRLVHEVRGEQHRDGANVGFLFRIRRALAAVSSFAAAPRQAAYDVPGVPPRDGVHPRGGLVQEHHARLADERDRQTKLASLTAGERPRGSIGVARQADGGERRRDARVDAFLFLTSARAFERPKRREQL